MAERTTTQGRARRRLALAGALGLALVGLLVAGAFALAGTEAGRAWLARSAAAALSTPGVAEVSIERLEGRLPHDIRVRGLRVRDGAGPWLSAASVELRWRPLALLSGRLHVSELEVAELELARLPRGADDGAVGGPGGVPPLPFEITVERVAAETVTLGPELLGERATLRLSGRLASRGTEALTTALVVARTDGPGGRAELNAVLTLPNGPLSLDLQVSEPAGGLVARALDLPDLPPVAATLSGHGPLEDWRGDLGLSVEDLVWLSADLSLSRGRATRFRIAGAAAGEARAEALPWALLAGGLEFELDGAWTDERVLTLDRVRLDGPPGQVELHGRLGLARLEVEARAQAAVRDPALVAALIPGARAHGLTVEAQVKGALFAPDVEGAVTADRLVAPGIAAGGLTARLRFEPERPGARGTLKGALSASGEIADLAAEDLEDLEPLLGRRYAWRLAGTLDLAAERLEAHELALRAGSAEALGAGTFDLAGGNAEVEATIAFADLSGLGPLLDLGIQGSGEVDAQVTASGYGREAGAALTARLRDLRLDEPVVHALVAGRADVSTDFALRPDGALAFETIKVETPAARLEGEAGLSQDATAIKATYRVSVTDAGVLAEALGLRLAGRAEVRGRAHGPAREPRFDGRLTVTQARVEAVDLGRLEATYDVADVASDPRGRLEVRAAPPFGAVQGATDYLVAGPVLRLSDLRLESRGASAAGELSIPLDGAPATGAVSAEAADLAPWLALAGLDGGGAGTAELTLSGDGGRQGAELRANLRDLSWRPAGGEAVRAGRAKIALATSDLTGTGAGTARLDGAGVELGRLRLKTIELEAEGDRAALELRLNTAGALHGPLALEAEGRLSLDAARPALELDRAEGELAGQPIRLRAPVRLTRSAETFELSELDVRFGSARLGARAELGPTRIAADLTVEALALADLAPLVPTAGLGGELWGEVSLAGPRDNPTGTGSIRLVELKLSALEASPAFGLEVAAEWRDRRLALEGRLSGTPERDAELAAELPLALAPDRLALVVPPEGALSGRLAWHGDLASVWPLVPLDGHQLSGASELSATLAGTPSAPEVTGQLRLRQGRYENLETGTLLKDVDLALEFDGRRAVLSRLSASDGGAGRLSAQGEAALDAENGFPFTLAAELSELAALRRDDVTAVTDGRIAFQGNLRQAALSGRFETRSVEIRIVDRLPPDVAKLDVIETDSSGKISDLRPQAGPDEGPTEVRLDIAVDMPRRVFVRGRGLDSEWAGELKVTGTTEQPVLEGSLSLVRGQLSVLAKPFRLTSGSVRFPGGAELVPLLDVEATHAADELTVTARVTGPATNPDIALSSSPELPRDEIVSRVLFGRATPQLSPLEAVQLAAAVGELTGAGGAMGAFDFARSLIGVDVLRLGTTSPGAEGAPGVEAGKYLTEDVYVGVKKGVTDESGAVGVEIELTPNISVESQTGTTGESDIGVKFKWDY